MREFMLELDYETKILRNLRSVWIQPMTMQVGWMLCYEDDIYDRGIIYRSKDKNLLNDLASKMLQAYDEGKNRVRL